MWAVTLAPAAKTAGTVVDPAGSGLGGVPAPITTLAASTLYSDV
jgi:hypothetical protein